MIGLTVCQPYAELIMSGRKRVENRTWPTKHRGRLAIHAGKSRAWMGDTHVVDGVEVDGFGLKPSSLAFGAVIGEVQVLDCVPFAAIKAGTYDKQYAWLVTHEHAEGPWCWILGDTPKRYDPVPWTGAQKLFDIDVVKLNQVANFRLPVRDPEL